MNPLIAVIVVIVLVAVATVAGFALRSRDGRLRLADGAAGVSPALGPHELGPRIEFGSEATLVQFSTEFCSRCPATARLLHTVSDERNGIAVVEVDLTHRADLAKRFSVLQTPTVLVLDAGGRERARLSGPPAKASIESVLDGLGTSRASSPTAFPENEDSHA